MATKFVDILKPLGASLALVAGSSGATLQDSTGVTKLSWSSTGVVIGEVDTITQTTQMHGNMRLMSNNIAQATIDTFSVTQTSSSYLNLRKSSGTRLSQLSVAAAENLGYLTWQAYLTGTGYVYSFWQTVVLDSVGAGYVNGTLTIGGRHNGADVNCLRLKSDGSNKIGPDSSTLTQQVYGSLRAVFGSTGNAWILNGRESGSTTRQYVCGADNSTYGIMEFYTAVLDGTGAVKIGGHSGNGAWNLGPSVTNNYNGQLHTVNGGLRAGNVTAIDQSGEIMVGCNCRIGSASAEDSRSNTTPGGCAIVLDNRTSNTVPAFKIYFNQANDGAGVSGDLGFSMTQLATMEVGFDANSGSERHRILSSGTTMDTFQVHTQIHDTRDQITGVGGCLALAGNYRTARDPINGVLLRAYKQNSTDSNYAFGFKLYTTPNGGIPTERLSISAVGISSFLESTDATSSSVGSVVFSGGIAVAKSVFLGGKSSLGTQGSTRSAHQRSFTDDEVYTITNARRGILMISDETTSGDTAFFALSNGTVTMFADPNNIGASSDTDGRICVYNTGGNFVIKNRLGGTKTLAFAFISTGPQYVA
jgi:hypothetical protein